MLAMIDGEVVDASAVTISVTDDGLLRGDGVFEVLRVYGGRPWALDEHVERMVSSAQNLRLPLSPSDVRNDLAVVLEHLGGQDVFVRLVATRGGRRIVLVEPVATGPDDVRLSTVVYEPPMLLNDIKSLSYAPNMLAVRVAAERGGDDALFVGTDGLVLEASRASFFYVLDDRLLTPPIDRILDSITRRHLLAATGAHTRPLPATALPQLQEAFIASTTKEVLPVSRIDDHALPSVAGEITRHAESALRARIQDLLTTTHRPAAPPTP